MPIVIVRARSADADTLAELLKQYLRERHPDHPGSSAAELRRDALGTHASHRVLLARRDSEAIGFIAWDPVYDMHWAAPGAQVADLYVVRRFRGKGVALRLLCALCSAARDEGARFVRASGFDRGSTVGRFYERVAVAMHSAECHLGGRAFRRLADVHGSPIREIVRSLPPREWNFSE